MTGEWCLFNTLTKRPQFLMAAKLLEKTRNIYYSNLYIVKPLVTVHEDFIAHE